MKADVQEKSIELDVEELVTWLLCRRFGSESDTGGDSILDCHCDQSEEYSSLLPSGEARLLQKTEDSGEYKLILSGKGAWRVHGGGFAGTIQAFVPNDLIGEYTDAMKSIFGDDACYVLSIRPFGGVQIH